MQREARTSDTQFTFLIVGILATGWLVFNMAAIPATSEQWISHPGDMFPVGWIIVAGFGLILCFNGWSVIQATFRLLTKEAIPFDMLVLSGGILCILLMGGEKAMIDEIARETRLTGELQGEWVVLYAGLTIQMLYCLSIVLYQIRSIRSAQ